MTDDQAPTLVEVTGRELVELLESPARRRDLGGARGGLVVIREAIPAVVAPELVEAARTLPVVLALEGSVDEPPPGADLVDVVATGDDLELLIERAGATPQAATTLAVLLRGGPPPDTFAGLAAESAAYATLQGGDEFRRWRASVPIRERPEPVTPSVRVTRHDVDGVEALDIVLTRPEVRNALDARLRDELWDALLVAASAPELAVRWRAEGPAFCSGGNLDEFGSVPDAATGHLVRLSRSLGLAIHELADRLTVHVHGACAGSGIELPAFAGRIVAAPDAAFSLPELGLGLIPGAGGTVSLPRRIGRHRTAWLVLTGRTIDAPTAQRWGLVDHVDHPDH